MIVMQLMHVGIAGDAFLGGLFAPSPTHPRADTDGTFQLAVAGRLVTLPKLSSHSALECATTNSHLPAR